MQQSHTTRPEGRLFRTYLCYEFWTKHALMLFLSRAGPCDVTKKEDLEKLVHEISKKEKHINLLSPPTSTPICQVRD